MTLLKIFMFMDKKEKKRLEGNNQNVVLSDPWMVDYGG